MATNQRKEIKSITMQTSCKVTWKSTCGNTWISWTKSLKLSPTRFWKIMISTSWANYQQISSLTDCKVILKAQMDPLQTKKWRDKNYHLYSTRAWMTMINWWKNFRRREIRMLRRTLLISSKWTKTILMANIQNNNTSLSSELLSILYSIGFDYDFKGD